MILDDRSPPQRLLLRPQLRHHHTLIRMIQEVLKNIRLLSKLLREDARNSRNIRMIMRLQRNDLPETAIDSVGESRIGLGGIERVVQALFLDFRIQLGIADRAVQHEGAGRVIFEQIVDPGDDGDDGGRRGVEGEAGEALDEAGDERGGQVRGAEEGVEQAEEAGAVFGVQQVGVEEGVELRVELGVVEVFLADEVEEARESEEGGGAADVVGVREEVHEEFGAVEPGLDRGGHDAEEGFALWVGEVVAEDCEPCFLGALFVGVY